MEVGIDPCETGRKKSLRTHRFVRNINCRPMVPVTPQYDRGGAPTGYQHQTLARLGRKSNSGDGHSGDTVEIEGGPVLVATEVSPRVRPCPSRPSNVAPQGFPRSHGTCFECRAEPWAEVQSIAAASMLPAWLGSSPTSTIVVPGRATGQMILAPDASTSLPALRSSAVAGWV